MKFTIDFELSHALEQSDVLARLVSKATRTWAPKPLEALVSEQFSLNAVPDYPLAAIAADADGLDVQEGYWLRADPVNLMLQRDSFSLDAPVPLSLTAEHAHLLLDTLNQHFSAEGFAFKRGSSGRWYLQLAEDPQIQTNLPNMAIGRNVHGFMPQGAYAQKWRSVLNEIQMLFFEHSVNQQRESTGEVAVNSVWLSGGGYRPAQSVADGDALILADAPLYKGLAKLTGLRWQQLPNATDVSIFTHSHQAVRLHLNQDADVNTWLNTLYAMLKEHKVKQLTLNIGFYDQCLIADIRPLDLFKFWRKVKPLADFLP